ncbi:MAG TPA: acyl carrier protein [Gemmatimonadaceae bacterium]|jgi:acyl carrier protein|nr:acyl carrier protein [Gemmatimonadaceae bacterium]
MNAQSTEQLQNIFRAVFELPDSSDVTSLRRDNMERWDSLAHVSLVVGIESEFGLSIDAGDQLSMTSYEATQRLLEERGL